MPFPQEHDDQAGPHPYLTASSQARPHRSHFHWKRGRRSAGFIGLRAVYPLEALTWPGSWRCEGPDRPRARGGAGRTPDRGGPLRRSGEGEGPPAGLGLRGARAHARGPGSGQSQGPENLRQDPGPGARRTRASVLMPCPRRPSPASREPFRKPVVAPRGRQVVPDLRETRRPAQGRHERVERRPGGLLIYQAEE